MSGVASERKTVCILAAGVGSRMGDSFAWINKALLPIEDRAAISWLIESFGTDARFVIGLGHKGGQVRGYLGLAHPGVEIEYVEVDPWSGPGSGPGRSLLCCREAIGVDRPFYFAPCDALIGSGPELERAGDWVGVAEVPERESHRYCNFELERDRVVGIADKRRVNGSTHRAFTGVMRIESARAFWSGLERSGQVAGEVQVSGGLGALVEAGTLRAEAVDWTDLGEEASYRQELIRRSGFDFSKPGEALYIVSDRVIKLFEDGDAARGRVARAGQAPHAFPPMIETPEGFVAYEYVPGETLYHVVDRELLTRLLAWADRSLWRPVQIQADEFEALCDGFYREKTLSRVRLLEGMGGLDAQPARVCGVGVPCVQDLLDHVNWEQLAQGGMPVFFHGDLQFDNILLRPDGAFTLLDWRQDFSGSLECGDLDYDLAKMVGGIRMNYALVKRGEIEYESRDDCGEPRYPGCPDAQALERDVLSFAESRGRDAGRIRLIVGLIYLNMAPLHGEPFSSVLRDAARLALSEALGVTQTRSGHAA